MTRFVQLAHSARAFWRRMLATVVLVTANVFAKGTQKPRDQLAASRATKARVETGEGVPFFDERFSCREDDVWAPYRELVQYARLRIFGEGEGSELDRLLSATLAARTANITEILQCNVGVIAGYHLLARRNIAESNDWKAYRLLQLALIYVFTLRNALQVPEEAARDWATRTDQIVQEIKLLRVRLNREQSRRAAWLPDVSPSLRIPSLQIAVVSICAYPKDHPLILRTVTPENRRLYAERHGYTVHVHLTHPLPQDGIHVQHSKLALVAKYLRMGIYDWVAWLDCDSIIMNLDRTLDSIIYRYARRRARPHFHDLESDNTSSTEESSNTAVDRRSQPSMALDDFLAEGSFDEPSADEELEAYVYYIGSCNSDAGCNASTTVKVNRNARYKVTVSTALIDMEQASEKLEFVSVGQHTLGGCNPMPETDYDCGYHECFVNAEVPRDEYASNGFLSLQVHSVRTHNDCRCSRLRGFCYSAALASFEEASEGEKTTDPSYGMFVKFTLTPYVKNSSDDNAEEDALLHDIAPEGCCCEAHHRRAMSRNPHSLSSLLAAAINASAEPPRADSLALATVRQRNSECLDPEVLLGLGLSLEVCLSLCREIAGCQFISHGFGRKEGQCFWELGECFTFEQDSFTVYDVRANSALPDCSRSCLGFDHELETPLARRDVLDSDSEAELDREPAAGDDGVDLLITEEGWGLSSANWLIRSSAWSISFLERAFALCHKDMPLFGDQDAMIHLLMNHRALRHDYHGDPLDPHAVIIPQRELNAYDALNAHYMGCDGYEDGDLLVTFPGCKDPQACNPLFRLAADHALVRENHKQSDAVDPRASMDRLRLFGPGEVAAAVYETARAQRRQRK